MEEGASSYGCDTLWSSSMSVDIIFRVHQTYPSTRSSELKPTRDSTHGFFSHSIQPPTFFAAHSIAPFLHISTLTLTILNSVEVWKCVTFVPSATASYCNSISSSSYTNKNISLLISSLVTGTNIQEEIGCQSLITRKSGIPAVKGVSISTMKMGPIEYTEMWMMGHSGIE